MKHEGRNDCGGANPVTIITGEGRLAHSVHNNSMFIICFLLHIGEANGDDKQEIEKKRKQIYNVETSSNISKRGRDDDDDDGDGESNNTNGSSANGSASKSSSATNGGSSSCSSSTQQGGSSSTKQGYILLLFDNDLWL